MSLGRCDHCGMSLRLGSGTCTRCGTKKRRLKYFLAALVLAQAVTIVAYMKFPHHDMTRVADASAAELAVTDAAPRAGWVYYKTRDEMIDDTTQHARVLSRGAADAGDVRDRVTSGVLELRASPTYGRSVVITLHRDGFGLIDEQCQLRAQFDAGDVQVFHVAGSMDGENATLIVDDTRGFTTHLVGARTLSIDARLSEKIERRASFDVGGLSWN